MFYHLQFILGGFWLGGFCPGDFCRGVMSGGFLSGGFLSCHHKIPMLNTRSLSSFYSIKSMNETDCLASDIACNVLIQRLKPQNSYYFTYIYSSTDRDKIPAGNRSSPIPQNETSKMWCNGTSKFPRFKFMSLNIFSLIPYLDNLRLLVGDEKPYVMCINETKLDSSIDDSLVQIDDYVIVRKERNVHGGGVVLYIHGKNMNLSQSR